MFIKKSNNEKTYVDSWLDLKYKPQRTVNLLKNRLEDLKEELFTELEEFAGYLAKYLSTNKSPNRLAVSNAMEFVNTIRQRIIKASKLSKKDQLVILFMQKYQFEKFVVDLLNKNSIDISKLMDPGFFEGR